MLSHLTFTLAALARRASAHFTVLSETVETPGKAAARDYLRHYEHVSLFCLN